MEKLEQKKEQVGVVFIHGAGLNGGIWSEVATDFQYPSLSIDLPMRAAEDASRKDLTLMDYVRDIKQQIDAWGVKRIVLVAHSLGGILALEVAKSLSDRLVGFVAVGAAIPKKGGSFLSILPFPKRMIMSLIIRKMGTKPPESAIRSGLCNDLSEAQAAQIVQSFAPESIRVYTDTIDVTPPPVPKLYVQLSKDRQFDATMQKKMIANLKPEHIRTLDSGHLPMISNPTGLRHVLDQFLSEAI
ncbi:alpha/beta hydrolase [Paenibacillus sp. N1-5-1-14]|uniref:alpha/beta fold hydrolase n=1 Tax=Paenibacillus radicibacter TaxID=2972488 RepID=UPI0021596C8F|nr:alpha/beta hydrolase [Paenibacillus radicibacter]MCR8644991.1 alpha/beta hydrolase [Paenibacillus radicibacter]